MAIVRAENLSKRFGSLVAVDQVSFSISRGEILGLLGPNGAGKTTVIQMLLGVLTPTSGTVSYFGKDLAAHREQILERIGFSSTYTNLPWNLRVQDALSFMSFMYDVPNRKTRVREIIEAFHLQALLNRSIVMLSAGEQTRLNLAKAAFNNPDVMLLDEPTASLDPEIAAEVRRYILDRQLKESTSILFTSHNMAEVEAICDRVIFVHGGKIVADGTPRKLARSIDISTVSLRIDPADSSNFFRLCSQHQIEVQSDEGEHSFRLSESKVVEFLSSFHAAGVRFHGVSVVPASLEDFFLGLSKK